MAWPEKMPILDEVKGMPDDWQPEPIRARVDITRAIQEAVPTADFRSDAPGITVMIRTAAFSVPIHLGNVEWVDCLMFHAYGGHGAAGAIARISGRLGFPVLHIRSETSGNMTS